MSVGALTAPAYRCPKCDAIGRLVNLQSAADTVTLSFECPYCKHSWTITKSDPLRKTPSPSSRLIEDGATRLIRLAKHAKELGDVTADAARTQSELAADIRRIGQRDRVTEQLPLASAPSSKKARNKKRR